MRRPSNTRRPAIHSGEGASTRERMSSLCPTILMACLTVCGPDMRSGNGRSILNHILGEGERDNSSSAVAVETGELPQSSWSFRELHN